MKKYSVITFLFNHYDLLREPLVIDENADYYCITDDKDLKSEHWTIIYIKEFDTDKLTGIQKTYMAKYSFYKYIPTSYEYYFTIDAALEIQDKLSPILQYMDDNNYDLGLAMHPHRSKWFDEYNEWIKVRGLDKKYYDIFSEYAIRMGYDPKSVTGLVECTVKIYKNKKELIDFIDDVYKTLEDTNNFEDKNDQCYFTIIFDRHRKKINTMFFYQQLYSTSKYFSSYIHNTNNKWITNRTKNNNTNILFGEKINLIEFTDGVKKCCVVFTIYKEKLISEEERSLRQCLKIFGGKRDIKFIIPNNMPTNNYDGYNIEYIKVNPQWLDSIKSYNRMCCSSEFYELFKDYDYILIHQTDAWVFEDRLDEFMELGYDYYGAPWPFWNNEVGNGGFSLRKVDKMLEITTKHEYKNNKINEDVWLCRVHKDEMNICPWEIAVNFSLETPSRQLLEGMKTIPMGLHGKKMIKFWSTDGGKFLEYKKKTKTAICCIGRKENQYAREFVEYYKKLGVDRIFIYDNNYDGEERFEDVLQDYIDNEYVKIINVRNRKKIQLAAYNDCYQRYNSEYNWIAFFDFDEFLVLENHTNIGDFLRQFEKYDCLLVNWMIMDDNGLTYNNHLPLMERFTHAMDYDKAITYDFPENNTVKSIVKCGSKIVFKTNPHVPSSKISCCDTLGNGCDSSPFKKYTFKGAYLKHFSTKTIEEWLNVKMKRGYPDGNCDWFKKNDVIGHFFKSNERTDEKLNFIEKHYAYLLGKEQSLDLFICTHKDFEPLVTNKAYKVINCNNINNDVWNGMKGSFYSEIMSYFYIAENYKLKDYVGFCHYRKYWEFKDDIPNLNELFKEYDAIVARPLKVNNVYEHYKKCHNIEDLNIVKDIIYEKFPDYTHAFDIFINWRFMLPYNMFIMRREDFLEYIEFIKNVLDEYLKVVGTDIEKRIEENKDKYLKKFSPNNTVEYQYRIGGYLAERLTNVFIIKKFKMLKTYKVLITENKYASKKEKK